MDQWPKNDMSFISPLPSGRGCSLKGKGVFEPVNWQLATFGWGR